jgi:hypothetical protein
VAEGVTAERSVQRLIENVRRFLQRRYVSGLRFGEMSRRFKIRAHDLAAVFES